MLYIGIDLGTSAVKLILTDENGYILNSVSREYPIYFPKEGWSEQNPEDWYNETINGLKELLYDADSSAVSGISFGGQMHGLVILDEVNEVIRPAILWNDSRSSKECDHLNNVIGKDKLTEYCGNIAFAGFTAPKLLWVKNNEPDNFVKIKKIMLPKDYLAYKLTGIFSTDVSDASGTLYFNVKNRCWSEEMMKICGIKKTMLPHIYESFEVTGKIKSEIAAELGIPQSTKIIAGAGDNAAAAVGTGVVDSNSCNISLGTSGTVFIAADTFAVDNNNALHSFAHANGEYHLMGCILSAASCNKWWLENILSTDDYTGEQEKINLKSKNNVYFLPYLMGERSPHNDPFARGTFIGLAMDTKRYEMTQAILEGVAFALRDSVEVARKLGIDVKSSMLCGGGTKSLIWMKIIANVMNIRISIPNTQEGPSYGAAILAMTGCGKFATVNEAVHSLIRIKDSIEPEPDLVNMYEEKYQKWIKIYPGCKEIFEMIAN